MPTDAAERRPSPDAESARRPGADATPPSAVADLQPHYGRQLQILETLSSARNDNDWIASLVFPHLELVRARDRAVVPLARRLEDRMTVPFGQSVFAVSAPRARPGARTT